MRHFEAFLINVTWLEKIGKFWFLISKEDQGQEEDALKTVVVVFA